MVHGKLLVSLVRKLAADGEFPDTLEGLCSLVGGWRGRAVLLKEIAAFHGPAPVAAQWYRMGSTDLVLYLSGASALYREWIVCHELAHMILGHPPRPLGCSEEPEELEAESLGAELVRLMQEARNRESSWSLVFA